MGENWVLTTNFRRTMPYRDLMLSKIEFSNLISNDLQQYFDLFITDIRAFMEKSQVFELFGYHRCFEITPENLEATRRWMRITTCLTRHEARVIAKQANFSAFRNMLDIGGNSGEFALQLCKENPDLSACVADLPVVCAVGREHVGDEPEQASIDFLACDALRGPLPTGHDLVTFKSILHDWPLEAVKIFLDNAYRALDPGGSLIICERGPLDLEAENISFAMVPMLLFSRSFRAPCFYQDILEDLGFLNITVKAFRLDTEFFLIQATRGD